MSNPRTDNDVKTTTATTTTASSSISFSSNKDNQIHILTTLQHHFVNEEDARATDDPSIDPPSNLINTWKSLNATLLRLHARRILDAASALGWTAVLEQRPRLDLDLGPLIEQAARAQLFRPHGTTPPPERGGMVSARVRVLVSETSLITIELVPMGPGSTLGPKLRSCIENYTANPFGSMASRADMNVPVPVPPSRVVVDSRPTLPSVFTRHKTTRRDVYDEARGRPDPPLRPTTLPTEGEVLLFNPAGEIMEASMSSVYFLRDGLWVTPRQEAGGMQSVTRMYALEKGWCVEGVVVKDSMRQGEVIWLSNAVRGFFQGRICL
ncbi:hypothetical protein G647_04236 [Cladophialophora carrionii CBS 160.54]|uniref:Uncharacterized protein n=1 Tax=Cladophialophora carrionii CBS 160.54 TaxID=1279043 RepID=V9DDY6_9EURO|nr:uncharacterized protein G647_04236 [Cladophialophora carrionii CBS 160.54]ETI24866.1 hypothetical protein G647_04236 [Cladophialophora carrionii CBS 160.54]